MPPYIYTTAWTDRALTVLDFANPAAPTFVSSIQGVGAPNFLERPRGIVVDRPYAYVINEIVDGLTIFDISNPLASVRVGGITQAVCPELFRGYRIVKRANQVFITSTNQGLTVVDVTDPTAPFVAGQWVIAGVGRRCYHIVLDGNRAFTTNGDRFCIIDITNIAAIVELSTMAGGGAPNWLNNARGLAYDLATDVLYICAEIDDALTSWDVSNSLAPAILDDIRGPGAPNFLNTAQLVELSGNYAYVAAQGDDGLTVIDITAPAAMAYFGGVYSLPLLPSSWGIRRDGTTIYLSDFVRGVSAIDITAPATPAILGTIQGAGPPNYLSFCYDLDLLLTLAATVQTDAATGVT